MIEYTIFTKPSILLIKSMWLQFFSEDANWHYNFYDGFIRLKLSKAYPKLDEFITAKKWRWEKNPYNQEVETLPVFKKNFDTFCKLLHCLSLLTMKEKDLNAVKERVIHLLLNMQGKSYWEEAEDLVSHGLFRAKLEGLYLGIQKSKDELGESR